jgi:hypothetical protein
VLFARFLAENGLLMHPDDVPLTLDECNELARRPGGWISEETVKESVVGLRNEARQ